MCGTAPEILNEIGKPERNLSYGSLAVSGLLFLSVTTYPLVMLFLQVMSFSQLQLCIVYSRASKHLFLSYRKINDIRSPTSRSAYKPPGQGWHSSGISTNLKTPGISCGGQIWWHHIPAPFLPQIPPSTGTHPSFSRYSKLVALPKLSFGIDE